MKSLSKSNKRRAGTVYIADFPEIMEEWDWNKNPMDPNKIGSSFANSVWFICKECKSSWRCPAKNRIKGKKCVCFGNQQFRKITDKNRLSTYDPELCKLWSPKNKLGPESYSYGSEEKVWWLCAKNPKHEYLGSIYDRARRDSRRSGCAICYGKIINEQNSVAGLFPNMVKFWAPENELTPDKCTPSMIHKILWICPKNPNHRHCCSIAKKLLRGDGCTVGNCATKGCSSRSQTQYLNYMRIPECWRKHKIRIGGRLLYPDALDAENKVWYEFNGDRWHGNPNKFDHKKLEKNSGKTFGELYQATIERENLIKSAGYTLIVMWEEDWTKLKETMFPEEKERLIIEC